MAASRTVRLSADERRVQIRESAREAFISKGYRGATTAGIAEACGVSDALVLKHFGSKEELFRAALVDPALVTIKERILANRAALSSGVGGDLASGTAAATAFLRRWVDLLRREGAAFIALVQDLRQVPDVAEQLRTILAADIQELADTLAGFLEGPAFRSINGRVLAVSSLATATAAAFVEEDPIAFLDDYMDLIIHGIFAERRGSVP